MSVSISSYSKDELPKILQSLKQYKKMLKEMGGRADMYFFTPADKNFRAEYDPTMDMSLVESYVLSAFASYFDQQLKKEDIKFYPNSALISGARIFWGDDMIDVTFKNIEDTVKQL